MKRERLDFTKPVVENFHTKDRDSRFVVKSPFRTSLNSAKRERNQKIAPLDIKRDKMKEQTQDPIALATYEDFGEDYANAIETNAWNAHYERPSTLSLLPSVHSVKVLDAGCGPGVYANWLVKNAAQVTAIDVSPSMVELAKRRVGNLAFLFAI